MTMGDKIKGAAKDAKDKVTGHDDERPDNLDQAEAATVGEQTTDESLLASQGHDPDYYEAERLEAERQSRQQDDLDDLRDDLDSEIENDARDTRGTRGDSPL